MIELIICLIIFATLSQIGFLAFRRYSRRAKAFATETALLNVMRECQSNILGGNLVTINDKDEYKWLQENIWKNKIRLKDAKHIEKDSDKPATYYVGLNDSKEEGVYEWSSGQKTSFGIIRI